MYFNNTSFELSHMFKTIQELLIKYKEIILYLIMGVATTVVNWVAYAIFVKLFPSHIQILGMALNILIANIIAWIIAVLFAYVTNKIFVFESYSWKPVFVAKEFGLFVSARAITGIFEILCVPFLVSIGLNQTILGVEGMLSKIAVSVIVMILNYVFSKLIIFKK